MEELVGSRCNFSCDGATVVAAKNGRFSAKSKPRLSDAHLRTRNQAHFIWHDRCLVVGMNKSPIVSFRDLEVWQRSMDLVDMLFESSRQIPRSEFDIRRQMRRAVVSIPSNLAEGYRRKKKTSAYQNHISIAMGSNGELETQVIICQRNNFITKNNCEELLALIDRVGAMLYRLHESLD